jgi:2-polyprenyl-6-methoxyphenol hydroxylase-like FAD-dependent oxidoreductase
MQVDVAVVGAGPVGCVAALAHARRGARVALIEANPARKNRFAGELLHPPAAAALASVGITDVPPAQDHQANRGFAVLSSELETPRILDYDGTRGLTFEFNRFVGVLRDAALAHPNIVWLPNHRVTALGDHCVEVAYDGGTRVIDADRVVGADGRFSKVRKSLGIPGDRVTLSHMAGLVLHGVELPHEGYGHVMLGGQGPVLAYRIAEDEVRICIDVPAAWKRQKDRDARIWAAIEPQVAPSLRDAIRDGLLSGKAVWAVNELRPRTVYGRGDVMLVGDAVGCFHPMTGIGMTLGFGDAVALAESDTLEQYTARRHQESLSPALLATALYEIFAVDSVPTRSCRRAVYDMWAGNPALATRSVSVLSAEDPSWSHLLQLGVEMVARASVYAASNDDPFSERVASVGRLGGLVRWLLSESIPPSMRRTPVVLGTTPFERDRVRALPLDVAA